MNKVIAILISITLFFIIPSSVFGDMKKIKEECADCHEKDGNSKEEDIPRIAGLSTEYFKVSLEAYTDETRPAKVIKKEGKDDRDMKSIVKELKENEIEELAKYFSGKKYKMVVQKFDGAKAKKGSKLHRKYCAKCHEDRGRAPEDDAGYLGGQHMAYMKTSLENYQSGKREMGKKMKKKWKSMYKKAGEDGIDQLLHFYASVK